jgi:hypothetical protein
MMEDVFSYQCNPNTLSAASPWCIAAALAGEASAECSRQLKANATVVRLLPEHTQSSDLRIETLSCAIVSAQGGHYPTVYVPAVRLFAAERAIAWDVALGYTIPNEIAGAGAFARRLDARRLDKGTTPS